MNWLRLENPSDFQQLLDASFSDNLSAVAIFKHSTRCVISTMAKVRLAASWNFKDELPIYYLDLIQHRALSNQVSEELGVEHQSPQLLLIKGGKCFYHTSHNGISVREINSFLKQKD
ncbi:MAG: bacillithiol system redox-active protein YtxJ [Bacteroidetes bacterium HGW-Bacteroidetes-12]|nr:MAG: bacillithiol system redox-active protein YtxJ [Bacteroidetes bacterium HGW-Bacteroidetes-12]